jgi:hypothetical protein
VRPGRQAALTRPLHRPGRRPRTLRPRCRRCAGLLEHCEGETYCPDCVSFTIPADAPPAPAWYDAVTVDGSHVHTGPDLGALAEWVRGVLDPGADDVLIVAAGRVVAVVRGDTGAVVRVR